MEEFVLRMCDEHTKLVEKINKLNDFLNSDDLELKASDEEIALMRIQLNCMISYVLTLEARIEMHVDKEK